MNGTETGVLRRPDLTELFQVLISRVYEVIGPTIRDNTILYKPLHSCDELPQQAPAFALA